jgi:putative tryptophan/tyrosine transport system substrate-binding protein
MLGAGSSVHDPSATLGVHCGNGFDAGFSPYQSTRFSRYNTVPLSLGADMRRRELITLLGGAAIGWPLVARAQQPAGMLRVGMVGGQPRSSPLYAAFLQRLAELGYQEGSNFTFEFIQAASFEDYARANWELVTRKVGILVASGTEVALKSALAATNNLPIVMTAIEYDPIALGYVTSLVRPASNITGIVFLQVELTTKRLQVVTEAFPDLRFATVFWDAGSADQWRVAQSAAPALGLQLFGSELREQPYDYEQALAQAPSDHRGWLFVMTSPFLFRDRERIAEFTLRHRVPSVFGFREWVDAGGLLSYGPSITGMYRRAADYVDRIARGAKPADLPIEQPTKFEFVLNLKTAKAIGLVTPTALLLRADEVIE